MNVITTSHIETPLGPMIVGVIDDTICLLEFTDRKALESEITMLQKTLSAQMMSGIHPLFKTVQIQMKEYFEGKRKTFDLPQLHIGTEFERAIWKQLEGIPYGQTRSYLQVAQAAGVPRAVRAAACAIGMNKICIVIPCHRVIGSNGKLTGYSAGLARKMWLLELEK